MSSPDVSVCMVTHNTQEVLRASLVSLFQSNGQSTFEVSIVDNHSKDGTLEMLRSEYPQIQLICLDHNAGYTHPMNLALRAARGRYLMQLNPDTLVSPGMLDGLLAYMDTHPEVGIVTPKVINQNGTLQKQCRRSDARPWDVFTYFTGLSHLFPKSRTFAGYLMTYRGENEIHEAEAVSGSCMLIRRAVVDQIGYLDEVFFAYQEDTDFCFRARHAGWKIVYMPKVSLIHYGGQGGSRVHPYRGILQWHRSYYLYYHKHLAKDYFFLVNWVMDVFIGLKLVASLAVNLFRKEKIVGSRKP